MFEFWMTGVSLYRTYCIYLACVSLEGEKLLEGDVGDQKEQVTISSSQKVAPGREATHRTPSDAHLVVAPDTVKQQVVELEAIRQAHRHMQT